jgi:hypothetical protein
MSNKHGMEDVCVLEVNHFVCSGIREREMMIEEWISEGGDDYLA